MNDLIKEIVANSAEKYGTTLKKLAGGKPEVQDKEEEVNEEQS